MIRECCTPRCGKPSAHRTRCPAAAPEAPCSNRPLERPERPPALYPVERWGGESTRERGANCDPENLPPRTALPPPPSPPCSLSCLRRAAGQHYGMCTQQRPGRFVLPGGRRGERI